MSGSKLNRGREYFYIGEERGRTEGGEREERGRREEGERGGRLLGASCAIVVY